MPENKQITTNFKSAEELFYNPIVSGRSEMIVEGLIPTGLTVIAGAPKSCKSWLMLSKFHDELLLPLGITYSSVRVSSERNYVFTVADDSTADSEDLTDASVKLDSAYSDDAHDAYDANSL